MSDQKPPPSSGDERQHDLKHTERGGHSRGRRRHQQQNQPRRPEPSLNMDELRDLVRLIADHGLTDFELEREGFRVRLRRDHTPQASAAPQAQGAATQPHGPAPSPASHASGGAGQSTAHAVATPHPGSQAEMAASEDEGLHIITSPIVGTFYRAASPTSEPFVRLGSNVDPDTVVCIIEAMKLMNEIQAETSGEVVKIYVENGQPVEYGQPLFGIKK